MFYHALTGKNEPTPVEDLEPVLLWENSAPTATFAAQTVPLDLTDYAGVIIEFNQSNASTTLYSRTYVKRSDTFNIAGNYGAASTFARNVSINDNEVTISNAYPAGSNSTPDNNILIPYRIYGVKYYIVENVDVIEEILTVISISSTYSGALVNLDTNHFEYTANTTGTRISLVGTEIKALTDGIYGTTISGNLIKGKYNAGDVISTVGSSGVVDVIAYK